MVQLLRVAAEATAVRDWDLALSVYGRLRAMGLGDYRLRANQAEVCWYADRPREAALLYAESAALAPSDPLPWRGLGNALRDLNRFEHALRAYRRSADLAAIPLTAWNTSQLLVGLEAYPQAFCLSENRFHHPGFDGYRSHGQAAWAGQEDPTQLAVWSEQGFGDGLQYLRWCVPLASRTLQLRLEVEPALTELIRDGLSWLPVPPTVGSKLAAPSPLASQEQHCSLLSLPHHLGGAPLASVFQPTERPGHWRGYLRHPDWTLAAPRRTPRVGLVWAAGCKLDDPFTAREYRKRTLPPDALGALLGGLHRQDVELVSLQIGPDHTMAAPWGHAISRALPQGADFALTARWIRQLDLLISVDTAAAHLAGALGHPCWLLLPFSADPRWLRDRHDTPWYPSLRLFRQPTTGAWQPVIDQVLAEFSSWWRSASG